MLFLVFASFPYSIYPKYWDILISYHTCPNLECLFHYLYLLTLVLLNPDMSCLCNVDPDQLASKKPTDLNLQFAIQYVNLCQKSGSSNLNGWKLGVAS